MFHHLFEVPEGESYGPLICYKGQSIAAARTRYGDNFPLALRQSAAEACHSQSPEFEAKKYGRARFLLDSSDSIPTYTPQIGELKTAYALAPKSVPKVYFIFSVLKSWDALLIAASEIDLMQAKGFQVIFAHGFDKNDLYKVIADDSTYGVILDSHGLQPFLGMGGGYWVDSKDELVYPDEFSKVSTNLKFFSALGCYGEDRAKEYQKSLHLSENGYHYLSGSHSKNVIDYTAVRSIS